MALRDQPYLPLYVNDFLSDEKLNNCSAESTGVYIRLMCLMHKSNEYGVISLSDRQIEKYKSQANHKQITEKSQANLEHGLLNHVQIFAEILSRHMPYSAEVIERGLYELIEEDVIRYEEQRIFQPRMVRDGALSAVRAKAGSAGGKAVRNSAKKKNYNEHGFLYVAEDCGDESCHKVGITRDLRNRLNGLRRQSNREMKYVFTAEVEDMGTTEDNVLTLLNDIRDGEWIYGQPLSAIMKAVNNGMKITSKSQANPEIEDEGGSEYEEYAIEGIGGITPYGKVMCFYMDKFNPTPSSLISGLLQDYTDALGADVVLHAMQIALDERKFGWSYLNAILNRYKAGGLNTMEKVVQSEQSFRAGKEKGETAHKGRHSATTFYDVGEQMKKDGLV